MSLELVANWFTWGLQALVGFACWIIWTKLDKNTEAIHRIEVLLPSNYITKEDFNNFQGQHNSSIHNVKDKVSKLELKEATRSGQEKETQKL